MTSDSAIFTATGGCRSASQAVSASTSRAARDVLTMKARATRRHAARLARRQVKREARRPSADARPSAVPGMWPADSEA